MGEVEVEGCCGFVGMRELFVLLGDARRGVDDCIIVGWFWEGGLRRDF